MSVDFTNAKWRKSLGSDSGDCVEVAMVEGVIGVRDTKDNGAGPILQFNSREWNAFQLGIGRGEFTIERLAE